MSLDTSSVSATTIDKNAEAIDFYLTKSAATIS
jgi:hypothetical protein